MSPWFLGQPNPAARMKLFCIPHAGRGASLYMPWRASLPPWIELNAVQLPGRESRHSESPPRNIHDLATRLAIEMQPRLDRPYVVFGHSMGALIAYETARTLRRLGSAQPAALVLSGRRAPTVAETNVPIHRLPDAEFVAAMCARYNGIPQIILDQPDMMRMFLPVMRADIETIETYVHQNEATALAMPFFVYGGSEDTEHSAGKAEGWRNLTTGRTDMRVFSGGHFYLQETRESLVTALVQDLAALGASDRKIL